MYTHITAENVAQPFTLLYSNVHNVRPWPQKEVIINFKTNNTKTNILQTLNKLASGRYSFEKIEPRLSQPV